ncbi:MAG: acetyltransferase [Bacillales bacterium]|jgi:ribosomal protein S18 acetylase RimI-like enzyme|nr:acetyltransferase [Bacillales bacterium]
MIEYLKVTNQEMIDEVRQLFIKYSKSMKVDLCFQNFEEELKTLPGKYAPPDGALIIAVVNCKAVGCVAFRKISDGICEMKRLYVCDDFRGLGIGAKLIEMVIEEARLLKYDFIRLDTLPTMIKAQELYLLFGFYDIDQYVFNPIEGARYMELEL